MIVCPNCNHPNPDGAVQCEACYTPLPATVSCPSCGATVQADASFCGQCGFNLRAAAVGTPYPTVAPPTVAPETPQEVPQEVPPPETVVPQPIVVTAPPAPLLVPDPEPLPPTAVVVNERPQYTPAPANFPAPTVTAPPIATSPPIVVPPPTIVPEPEPVAPPEPEPVAFIPEPVTQAEPVSAPAPSPARTQLQQITSRLVHVQSEQTIELPQNIPVIHIGKPNDRIPPDIDVSGFSNSEIVSRIHADIRVEADAYYIEDVGSSNGTYINNLPLLPGNRHRLRPGDRIGLGKGDLVTFLFQTVEI
ncbi:peptide-binding protein [Calothrix sp. HK-06]|nr:peptide-binding protein [Calothrix sp. HK-06]